MNKFLGNFFNFSKFTAIILIAVLCFLVGVLPIALKFYGGSEGFGGRNTEVTIIFLEIFAAFLIHYLFTFILLGLFNCQSEKIQSKNYPKIAKIFLVFLRRFSFLFWLVWQIFGFLACYFFVVLGKGLDAYVISDILENFSTLTMEYLSLQTISLLVFVTIFLALFSKFALRNKSFQSSRAFIAVNLLFAAALILIEIFDPVLMRKVHTDYPPINIFRSFVKYRQISSSDNFDKTGQRSLEIIKENKFVDHLVSKKPKTIIYVIGESTRSDKFFEMKNRHFPQLGKNGNTVFFQDVSSCDTLTRKSLPCMLTSVDHANWQNFPEAVSLIDVFNSLKYNTYWIDNQNLYGYFDSTYSFLAKASDVVIEQKFIATDLRKDHNYDEVLLPYVEMAKNDDEFGKEKSHDKFIIIHMMGSHWHLDKRYPKTSAKYSPTCHESKDLAACSIEQISNSYKNSVFYNLEVLQKIIDIFADENALVVFSSDHGFSLGENGVIGNGSPTKPVEQIKVPMFIWYSNSYKAEHQELMNNLQKNILRKTNLTHEYLFHSILGCSEISSMIVKNSLNLCSKNIQLTP